MRSRSAVAIASEQRRAPRRPSRPDRGRTRSPRARRAPPRSRSAGPRRDRGRRRPGRTGGSRAPAARDDRAFRCGPGPPSDRRPRGLAAPEIGERHAIAEVDVPRVAREQRPRVRIDLGDDGRARSRFARRPGPTRRTRSPTDARDLPDRFSIVSREIFTGSSAARTGASSRTMPWERVLEAAVALTMPGDVGRRVLPDGQRRRAPQRRRSPRRGRRSSRPGGSLTGSLDHGVSWFSRLLTRPRVAGPGLGDLEAEARDSRRR